MSYPQYAASLFAGNDLCRSAFAFAAILFARPMFLNLGIGRGVSLLAGLSVLGIVSFVRCATSRIKLTPLILDRDVVSLPLRCSTTGEIEVCAEVKCKGFWHLWWNE